MAPAETGTRRLRVVVSDERRDVVEQTRRMLESIGHEVVAREIDISATVAAVERHHADLAVVAVHDEPGHALEIVEQVNDTAACPVVLVMDENDPAMVARAVERGITAYATRHDPEAVRSAIALALRIFHDVRRLGREAHGGDAGAERRATIERAKGVLMQCHDVDEEEAYLMLRARARETRARLVDVAWGVLAARPLLAGPPRVADAPAPGDT